MTKYGYIRVSSKEQNVARQLNAMSDLHLKKIFIDKQSGRDFERPQYKRLIKSLKANDVIYVKSIDRLGRNYKEIQEQWRTITHRKQADICVIDMPLLDTRKGKDLIGTFVSDLTLQVLSFVAQTERDMIKQRQREGIEAAKKRGVKFGRPRTISPPPTFETVRQMWSAKEIGGAEAARKLGITRSRFIWLATRDDRWYKGLPFYHSLVF